jgi:ADP-ribosylglycohydrolase/sugar/nucleoside kinase (ribokinase family)
MPNSSDNPALLVAGSAALLDLILQVDRFPGPSEVAHLLPDSEIQWLPGGCAITIALAAAHQGVRVRLWHPLPAGDDLAYSLAQLRQAGVDLGACPRFLGPPGRCVMVYGGHQRAAWTNLPQGDDFEFESSLLDGVSQVVITAKWGRWTERLLNLAQRRGVPCALVGEAPPLGFRFPWHAVVVDENQSHRVREDDCQIRVVTRGREGATVAWSEQKIYVPAVQTDVLETTGAGDVFGGTFVARILQNPTNVSGAAAEASVMAAKACSVWGAQGWSKHIPKGNTRLESRVRGALWGQACGDAFGMPNAFLQQPRWLDEMQPGPADNPYHAGYPPGRITDDTEQALALTDAIEEAEGFPSPQDYALKLFAWFERVGGEESLAVGPSTMQAMLAFGRGTPVTETGVSGTTNGAAMRIAPVGVLAGLRQSSLTELLEAVLPACMPTHYSTPAIAGAMAVAGAVAAAIRGLSWPEIMDQAIVAADLGRTAGQWHYAPDLSRKIQLSRGLIQKACSESDAADIAGAIIGAGMPVAESVAAAIAIADFAGGDPDTAIRIAGNTAGDADTVAAIAGSICGAFAGEEAIPLAWRKCVSKTNDLNVSNWSTRLQRAADQRRRKP